MDRLVDVAQPCFCSVAASGSHDAQRPVKHYLGRSLNHKHRMPYMHIHTHGRAGLVAATLNQQIAHVSCLAPTLNQQTAHVSCLAPTLIKQTVVERLSICFVKNIYPLSKTYTCGVKSMYIFVSHGAKMPFKQKKTIRKK